jgi:hypothetical protein
MLVLPPAFQIHPYLTQSPDSRNLLEENANNRSNRHSRERPHRRTESREVIPRLLRRDFHGHLDARHGWPRRHPRHQGL